MICYIGLGANLGERQRTLRRAIERVKQIPAVKLLRVSSFYETEPWGVVNQPDFLNAVIKIATELEPLTLLDELQRIEAELGRVRREHWGARTIDLDILLIEGLAITCERLTVPHKFLFERDFALIPLAEICRRTFKLRGDVVKRVAGSPIDFKFKLVACVDKTFGLGFNGKLLFHIPEDLKHFRRLTLNHTIIYGRRTLETFPNHKPLDGRRNIILSRSHDNKIAGAEVVGGIEELFDVLAAAQVNYVIGGAQVFEELIPYAKELILTVVDAEVQADVYFPSIDEFTEDTAQIEDGFEFRRYTR